MLVKQAPEVILYRTTQTSAAQHLRVPRRLRPPTSFCHDCHAISAGEGTHIDWAKPEYWEPCDCALVPALTDSTIRLIYTEHRVDFGNDCDYSTHRWSTSTVTTSCCTTSFTTWTRTTTYTRWSDRTGSWRLYDVIDGMGDGWCCCPCPGCDSMTPGYPLPESLLPAIVCFWSRWSCLTRYLV